MLLGRPINSSRHHLAAWVRECAATVPAGALVLDAGAGDAPYQHLFAHARYESADFRKVEGKGYAVTTYVCDLTAIPVEDERFDVIVCNQVLEHVADPLAVLVELRRVAKPGAGLWLSAPLFYEEHEQPYDFYRYTRFGWQHLAETAGLTVESIQWLEGYHGTLSHQLSMAARSLPKRYLPLRIVFAALARWFSRSDRKAKVVDRGMPKNYACVLRRPHA